MKAFLSNPVGVLVALQLSLTAALPNVTVVPLRTSDCVDWPLWQNVRGEDITGGFHFVSDQNDDEGSSGLRVITHDALDTHNATQTYLVVDVRKSALISPLVGARCINSTVQLGIYGLDPKPAITINKQTGRLHAAAGGYKLEPYAHEINGVRQPGLFLGTRNLTTWAFSYVRPQGCGGLDYFDVQLEGLPDAGAARGGPHGFLRADGL
ncbi:hypothetical protein GQ53DRAFT_818429 [Thozetella sp. PMI_491]|nr:hypothetical protein GQ53DRAFT_818429 [Thozetella sp. PMI_491]